MQRASRRMMWASASLATLVLLGVAGCGGQADEVVGSLPAAARVENPFSGVKGYVNPEWKAHVLGEFGGDRVANTPTAIWLRSIASISGANGGTSLQQHLDNALAQGAGYVEVVLYDLPGRDCAAWTLNTELQSNELSIYEKQFVDPIAAVEGDSKYAGLRIVNIIEPKALASLITNLSDSRCSIVQTQDDYVGGIQYALGRLGAIPNAYNYLDIGHHGVLGWPDNMTRAVALYASTIQGATGGFGTVAGFVSNVANYSATVEPYFQASTVINGTPVRQSRWVDWASYVDEQSFAGAWKTAMVGKGMSDTIGMLIDTSRNGWGGSSRPTQPSTSTDVNTFVNESRIDRRSRVGNWCNQMGAGLGARPQVVESNGIQAYVWIKPPGESDGAALPSSEGKGFDPMCNPAYEAVPTSALPSAPVENAWFSTQFQELMANAYPPLEPVSDTVSPSTPSNLSVSTITSSSVTLHWTASTDNVAVIAYDVYRDAALFVSVQGTTATVPGPAPASSATYAVRARDAAGNASAPSPSVTATLTCCGTPNPPSVPTNVTYSMVTYSTVTLSWTASTDEVGMGEYELFDSGVMIGHTKSTQYEVTGLLPGTTHTFTVRAVNSQSMHSSDSSPVTVTTLSITVPSAPTNLRWNASGGTVELCWDAPSSGSEPYGYSLFFGSYNLGTFGETCIALIGFKPGTPYTFTVKTVDANGNVSVASNMVTILLGVEIETTPPSAPTGLIGSVLSSSSVRLTWNASTDDVGVVLYQIYSSGALLQTVAGSTSATVTKLTVGQAYTFTVKALDAAGSFSSASSAVTLTPMAIDPTAPTNLRVTSASNSQAVVLSWDPPSTGEAVVGYELYQLTALKAYLIERTSITSAVVSSSGELNQIVVGTYFVNAIHAAGDLSPASAPIAVTFKVGGDPLPLDTVPEFKATATTSATATLTWSPTSSPCSIWYGVYSDNLLMALTAGTTATISNLTAGKSYVFKVIARDSCAQAGGSASITVKPGATLDTTPPSTPSNFKVTANTGTGSKWILTWSASTDNVGVVGYDLYCHPSYSSYVRLASSSTTNTMNVAYDSGTVCTVRARDAVGNSSSNSNSGTFP